MKFSCCKTVVIEIVSMSNNYFHCLSETAFFIIDFKREWSPYLSQYFNDPLDAWLCECTLSW